jgi:hypothetical protein
VSPLRTALAFGMTAVAKVLVARLLPAADSEARYRAPNRCNLEGNHAHSTPLHQAVLSLGPSTGRRRTCPPKKKKARP